MTIPQTTVPAVRQYLVTQLQSAVASVTPAAEVFDGEADHADHENWIEVGGVRRQVSPLGLVGSGGQFWRDEKYHVDIKISCYVGGRAGAMAQVNTNAYALLALVETVVRQDPSLGGLVLQANPESSDSVPSWDETGSGALCDITTSIEVYTTL
jgi:hypothetical protein